ncbi:Hypothetical protein A7982_02404 [Minicystis rosea]|nr:Hypothetical protein A7982_02404 [Minicystis rosea]
MPLSSEERSVPVGYGLSIGPASISTASMSMSALMGAAARGPRPPDH